MGCKHCCRTSSNSEGDQWGVQRWRVDGDYGPVGVGEVHLNEHSGRIYVSLNNSYVGLCKYLHSIEIGKQITQV